MAKQESQIKIEYENNILVRKVFEIERRPMSRDNFGIIASKNTPRFKSEIRKVQGDNEAHLNKILSASSLYSLNRFEKDYKNNKNYRRNILGNKS